MRSRNTIVVGISLAVLFMLFAMWRRDRIPKSPAPAAPRAEDTESAAPLGAVTPVPAVGSSASRREAATATAPAEPAAAGDPRPGTIRLLARYHGSGAPVPDLRILLLPPRSDGGWWDDDTTKDDVVAACRSSSGGGERAVPLDGPGWADYRWLRRTDAGGAATFDHLPADTLFQLQVADDGLYEFEANVSPLLPIDVQQTRTQDHRKRTITVSRLGLGGYDTKRLSGWIPVRRGVTETAVEKHRGATVRGTLPGQGWDSAYVTLNRQRNGIRWTVQWSRDLHDVAFGPVPAGNGYELTAHLTRGAHHYFADVPLALGDGEQRDLGELPLQAPDAVQEFRARLADPQGRVLDPTTVLDRMPMVWITVMQKNPSTKLTLQARLGESCFAHGLGEFRVAMVEVPDDELRRTYVSERWTLRSPHWPERDNPVSPTVVDIVAERALPLEPVMVTVEPPSGRRYARGVVVDFHSRESGATIAQAMLEADQLTATCPLPIGTRVDAVLVSRVDDRASAGSIRKIENVLVSRTLTLHDPGPPNGAGLAPR